MPEAPRSPTSSAGTEDIGKPSAGFLLAIAAVTCLEFFETGMVTFTAGPIMNGLGVQPDGFSLSFTVYAVAAIFMLYKHQWVVERFGYRNFTLLSLLMFALGAVICASATGLPQYLLGRALQGASGATFFTAGRLEVNRIAVEHRFHGIVTFVASLLGATAIAPLAAASLTQAFGWRALFWVTVPLAALIGVVSHQHLSRTITPATERSEEHWGWLIGLVLALIGLQYALQQMQYRFFSEPWRIFVFGLPACVALTAFAWRQWHKDRPLIDYRALLHWRYAIGILLYFFGYFMAGTSGFLLPIFAQQALGISMLATGAVLTAAFSGGLIAAVGHAFMFRRWHCFRPYMLAGLAMCLAAWLGLALLGPQAGWSALLLPALLSAASSAFFFGPVAFGTFAEVPQKAFSHAYQVKNIVRQLGLSCAVAVSTVILQWRYAIHLGSGAPGQTHTDWATHLIGHGAAIPESAGAAAVALYSASIDTFIGCALLIVPVTLLVWRQRLFR